VAGWLNLTKQKHHIMRRTGLLFLLVIILQQYVLAQVVITGTITSVDDNLGLPGAAVVVKGTTVGTTADIDGKYKITVPQDANLVFSFVGMASQEVKVTSQTVIDIVLRYDVFKMEEVVVAGVASATPKRNLSVSVARVDSKSLEDVPPTSAASALQGKVAGVTIISGSGTPGTSSNIRLRGTNSLLEGESPLIIVDGVMFEGELADINADDIDNIDVVKGASASALYGSKAGSGVLVITSKRGKFNDEATTDVKVRNEYGGSGLEKEISLATHHPYKLASDYTQPGYTKYAGVTYPAGYSGGKNDSIKGSQTLDFDHYADNPYSFVNDPQKEIFQSGQFYTNYVSVASNSKKTTIFMSFENNYNSGIIFNSTGSSRQNYRINVDHKISDQIKISSSTLIAQNSIDKPSEEGNAGPFFNVLHMSPDINLNMASPDTMVLKKYYYKPDPWSNGENPKHQLYYEQSSQKRLDILQNFSGNWNIAPWINFDASYSFEKLSISSFLLRPIGYQMDFLQDAGGLEGKSTYDFSSQTAQFTANLQRKFGDLVTKAKLSYMFEKYLTDYLYGQGSDMMASGLTTLENLRSKIGIGSQETKILAKDYFGILDMVYKDKYITSLLYRYDGSSLFGPESRWNPYYRASFGYRLNEDVHLSGFQEIKLTAAVGTSGQRPGFDYQYETYSIVRNSSIIQDGGLSSNSKIKPADTKETEFTMNTQFLENFNLEVVRSFATTTGAFFQVPLPAVTGYKYYWANAATTSSNTWEITFGTQLIKKKDIDWSIHVTFDKTVQKVTDCQAPSLPVGPYINGQQIFRVGKGSIIGQADGYSWVNSLKQMANQLPKGKTIADYTVNSDGYVIAKGTEGTYLEKPIALNQDHDSLPDLIKIADFNPNFNLNFSTNFKWKNIGISMLWVWKQGGDIYNMTKQSMFLDLKSGVIDQSGKPGYQKKTIDYYSTFYDFNQLNSYFVEDGTYLKLRELSIYYTLPEKATKNFSKSIIKNIRIGVVGRNLLTFTKYTGWDPEVSTAAANGSGGTSYILDYFNYPNFRSYSVSMDINF
jgi:TonB-linked SusC/RagA family outer membrane protein